MNRTAVMSHEALQALKQWLSVRESNCDYVFTAKRKETRLTVAGVSETIDRYKMKLDIQGRCSPHQSRHRWCRKQIQEGMPLTQVSQSAGHTSIVVTSDYYGTFAFNELQEAFDKYHNSPYAKYF
jgi:site-specific recombinase XerD